MGTIALDDIRLPQFTLQSLPAIAELRAAQMKLQPQVCIERAFYITRYLRDMADPPDGHLKIPHPWPGQNPPLQGWQNVG